MYLKVLYWDHSSGNSRSIICKLPGHYHRLESYLELSCKASHQQSQRFKCFLQWNLKHCPTNIKVNCYKGLVRPVIEYAAMVWEPYTHNNISAIEVVQRRAARFVYNNYLSYTSVNNMIANLASNSLYNR